MKDELFEMIGAGVILVIFFLGILIPFDEVTKWTWLTVLAGLFWFIVMDLSKRIKKLEVKQDAI